MFCPNALVWGDVATWLGAVGTVCAFFVALAVWIHSNHVRRRAEHRQQAELITGWI